MKSSIQQKKKNFLLIGIDSEINVAVALSY